MLKTVMLGFILVANTTFASGAEKNIVNEKVDWTSVCHYWCAKGMGGAACNCDRPPF